MELTTLIFQYVECKSRNNLLLKLQNNTGILENLFNFFMFIDRLTSWLLLCVEIVIFLVLNFVLKIYISGIFNMNYPHTTSIYKKKYLKF